MKTLKKQSNQLIDLSLLTVEELLEEVHKRVQASPDTQIKREISKIVERKTLPSKRKGFTQKVKNKWTSIIFKNW